MTTAADDNRSALDTPVSEFRVTPEGRWAAICGDPDLPPEALDILAALAYWEETRWTAENPHGKAREETTQAPWPTRPQPCLPKQPRRPCRATGQARGDLSQGPRDGPSRHR